MAFSGQPRRAAERPARRAARRLAGRAAWRLARRPTGRLARRTARRLARRTTGRLAATAREASKIGSTSRIHRVLELDTLNVSHTRSVQSLGNAVAEVDHRRWVHLARNTRLCRKQLELSNALRDLIQLHLQSARLNVLGLHAHLAQRQREARDDHTGRRVVHVHEIAARRHGATRRPAAAGGNRAARGRRPASLAAATHQDTGVHLTAVQAVRGTTRRPTGRPARGAACRPTHRPPGRPTSRPARGTTRRPARRPTTNIGHGRGAVYLYPKKKNAFIKNA